jgi:hypothetical protein
MNQKTSFRRADWYFTYSQVNVILICVNEKQLAMPQCSVKRTQYHEAHIHETYVMVRNVKATRGRSVQSTSSMSLF